MGSSRKRAKSARKKKSMTAGEATSAVSDLVSKAPAQKARTRQLPLMRPRYLRMVESTFDLPNPDELFEELQEAIEITDALTPGKLQAELNKAEKNALRAHKLYVNTKTDHIVFEIEMDAVMGAMRDKVTAELQAEKDRGERNKAITDKDIKEYIAWRYADEWSEANTRKAKAEGMLKHVQKLADLWTQRCKSIASMLHAKSPT